MATFDGKFSEVEHASVSMGNNPISSAEVERGYWAVIFFRSFDELLLEVIASLRFSYGDRSFPIFLMDYLSK